jgi:hypothetical protein
MTIQRILRCLVLSSVSLLVPAMSAVAQESTTVTLPSTVSFSLSTLSSVTGSPGPASVTYSDAVIVPGRVLRVSVMAVINAFSGSDQAGLPASAVSWTVSNISGGVASAGTLTSSSYTQMFQSHELSHSGSFDVTWTLTPSEGITAGLHTLGLRWKLESVLP